MTNISDGNVMPNRPPSSEESIATNLSGDFSSLNLSDISPSKKAEKQPKRILHFSDGTLEEYSSEEEETNEINSASAEIVNPKTLPWGPWMTYWASRTGNSILSTCDYVGEGIANALGITSQKYFYEIEEYKRAMKEEEDEKKEMNAQLAGWVTGNDEEKQKPPDLEFGNFPIKETKVQNKF